MNASASSVTRSWLGRFSEFACLTRDVFVGTVAAMRQASKEPSIKLTIRLESEFWVVKAGGRGAWTVEPASSASRSAVRVNAFETVV